MNNSLSQSDTFGLEGIYHNGKNEETWDYFSYHFSSPKQMIDSAKESLLIRGGVFYFASSPMFDTIPLGIKTASDYCVFNHRFYESVPDDTSVLFQELKIIGICVRLLKTVKHENRIGNKIPVVHKKNNPLIVWSDKQLERYEIKYDASTGGIEITTRDTSGDPIDVISKQLYSIHTSFVRILQNRCSSDVLERYVNQLMDVYFINGHTAFEESYDELQYTFLTKEIDRLKNTYWGKYGIGEEGRLIENYKAELDGLINKYKHQDNYLGRWVRSYLDNSEKSNLHIGEKSTIIRTDNKNIQSISSNHSSSNSQSITRSYKSGQWVESLLKKNNLSITGQTYELLRLGEQLIYDLHKNYSAKESKKEALRKIIEQLPDTPVEDDLRHLLGYADFYFDRAYDGKNLCFEEMIEDTYNYYSKESWDAKNILKRLSFDKEWINKCLEEEEAYKKQWEDILG